jgi:proteasome activator subunit 3 (PA28 gamma)
MENFLEQIKSNAENLVKNVFPQKILELDDLIKTDQLKIENMSNILDAINLPSKEDLVKNSITENDTKLEKRNPDLTNQEKEIVGKSIMCLENDLIQTNQKLIELLKIIKPFIIHFLDSLALIKLWIRILIPQVEDFKTELSLQVQLDSLEEIKIIETEVAGYTDRIYTYNATRGRFASKLAKYPHVNDFRESICEIDEEMFLAARSYAMKLRNHYIIVHDILMKNLEKIKSSKTNYEISMY